MKNYIIEYEKQIRSGKIVACRKIKVMYQQLVKDLKNKKSDYVYDHERAEHAINFIESYCRHSKGAKGGQLIELELWQKAALSATFGFVHKKTRLRKYREVILIVARKNGKSVLASAIGLYLLIYDGELGAEVYSVATKKDQAKIIWNEAKSMIRKSPELSEFIKNLNNTISFVYNDSKFEPLASDSGKLDGLNVSGLLIDELHAIKDMNLYDVTKDGTKARREPLTFITSTAGTVRESIFDNKYEDCEQIINNIEAGEPYDQSILVLIYESDHDSEWQDPTMWMKPNPGLGTIKNIEELALAVARAKAKPRYVKNLKTKDFNVRDTAGEAWLSFADINNEATFDIKELKPDYVIGGFDLSATTDLTCASIIFMKKDTPHIYVMQMYWIPEDVMELREKEDKIPYRLWQERGLVRTTAGNKIEYEDIEEWFLEIIHKYDLTMTWCGYDTWCATYLIKNMKDLFGANTMLPVRQGAKTLSTPMKALESDLRNKLIIYNNNPILKWCMTNTAIITDANDNIRPVKTAKQRRRIDGLISLLNAYVALLENKDDYINLIQ